MKRHVTAPPHPSIMRVGQTCSRKGDVIAAMSQAASFASYKTGILPVHPWISFTRHYDLYLHLPQILETCKLLPSNHAPCSPPL